MGGAASGEGGDRLVCDDPHNVQEAESDSIRKGTVDWFDVVMSTRVNDPRTTAKVVVMQRCHQQDLSGHLLEQGDGNTCASQRNTRDREPLLRLVLLIHVGSTVSCRGQSALVLRNCKPSSGACTVVRNQNGGAQYHVYACLVFAA